MLYVFHVDTGTMLTFDMKLAMSGVSVLQEAVSRTFHVSADKQVLLISGGENLDPNATVGSYHAGTDTNPIFLFSKSSIEAATPPSASVNYGSEADLKDQVEGCIMMSATFETVVARAQLALQFSEVARDELQVCERLVRDQHLQHQGWGAVIANLEDITSAFKNRSEGFKTNFEEYLKNRIRYMDVLKRFPQAVRLLGKVPLLQCLLGTEITPTESESEGGPQTLLQWISAQDSRSNLDTMVHQCQSGLHQFNDSTKDSLLSEVSSLLDAIHNQNMKEVKGLEDRLYGLEQLLIGARKLLQEQDDMAQGFIANQTRVSKLRDPSILPDLCNSHKKQLGIMLKNHQSMRDIRRRCTAAKEELSANLHTRLRWVMVVEKSICDVDRKLMIHHDTLKKLKRRLEIVQQMENAPNVYAQAVVEVVRRKQFSNHFLEWAGSLADECRHIHHEEVEKREQFYGYLKRHFLQSLFPGFEDTPPKYAADPPGDFDDKLPPITEQDLEFLRGEVPELAEKLKLPLEGDGEMIPRYSTITLRSSPILAMAGVTPPQQHALRMLQPQSASDIIVLNPELQEYPSGGAVFAMDTEQMGDLESVSEQPQDFLPLEGVPLRKEEVDGAADAQMKSVEVLEEKEEDDEEGEFLSLPSDGQQVSLSPPPEQKLKPPSPAAKHHTRDTKSSSEPSPDGEEINSEGFASADFYIDESMPSSMTESPPTKRLIAELQQSILAKNNLIESRDRDLEERTNELKLFKERLAQVTEHFHNLHDLANKGTVQLRSEVLSLQDEFRKDKSEFVDYVDQMSAQLVDSITRFQNEQTRLSDEATAALRQQYDDQVTQLTSKLESQNAQLAESAALSERQQTEAAELKQQCEAAQHHLEVKVAEMEVNLKDAVESTRNTLILEHEVELEKVQHDLRCDLELKDKEISELRINVEERERAVLEAQRVKEEELEAALSRFQQEKSEVIKAMTEEAEGKKTAALEELRTSLEVSHKEAVEQLTSQHGEELEAAKQALKAEHETALSALRGELETGHQKALEDLTTSLTSQHEEALVALRSQLTAEFEQTKAALVAAERVKQEEIYTQTPEEESLRMEEHGRILTEMKAAMEEQHQAELAKALSERDVTHNQAMDEMKQRMEQEKQTMATSMQTSATAEQQVLFNEALNKVVAEKDKVIEELRQKEAATSEERDALKARLASPESSSDSLEVAQTNYQELQLLAKKSHDELVSARSQIQALQEQLALAGGGGATAWPTLPGASMGMSAMGQSVVALSEGSGSMPASVAAMQDKIQFLEMTLKSKDEEMSLLRQKMMNLSMTTSSRSLAMDKVSITTCQVGDLVLLCLDERHDHYVVFNMGSTLHFLHSECLGPLGLTTNPGETRKSWVLAEITEKEYCQAKKAQNRFKVPLGTKFYRVKAKRWDRDASKDATRHLMRDPGPSHK